MMRFGNTNNLTAAPTGTSVYPRPDTSPRRGGARDAGDARRAFDYHRAARFLGKYTRVGDATRIRQWLEFASGRSNAHPTSAGLPLQGDFASIYARNDRPG